MASVFISYRQTGESAKNRVRTFAERLRDSGVDVILDQFYLDVHPGGPDQGWDKWSSDSALQSERVLIIGSVEWFDCFEKRQPAGSGLGAACEADDLRHRIYKSAGVSDAIRVVMFDEEVAVEAIPAKLQRYHCFDGDRDFDSIVRWLLEIPASVATAVPRASIPNNLPRLDAFFGREDDLRKIAEGLLPDARGWGVLIDGPGGIGKTTIAIRAASMIPLGRFRRIIFLSAKERELTADGQRALGSFTLPGYVEILNAIARELDKPKLLESTESERADAILRALRGADVLLILDNLETLPEIDRDRLFLVLNRLPPGSSAIVTSRRRAEVGAMTIRLDRLAWGAAQELIYNLLARSSSIIQCSDAEARELYDQMGGNPLLIRWVLGQVTLGYTHSIAEAIRRLKSVPASDNPLEFVFGDLLDSFTDAESQVLAALTHFTTMAPVKHVAELAGLNELVASSVLTGLAARSLVIPDNEDRRFGLVPLVAEFLRSKCHIAVQQTGNRLEDKVYALLVSRSVHRDRYLDFEAEWDRISAAIPRFLATTNSRLQIVTDELTDFLNWSGRWDALLSLSQKAEEKARIDGDWRNAGWRAFYTGMIYYYRGQELALESCITNLKLHWGIAKVGAREQAFAFRLRGHMHQLKKEYPLAIDQYLSALELHRSVAYDNLDAVTDLNSLACVEKLTGALDAAESHFHEALRIALSKHSLENIATITGNLADLALDRYDWANAEYLAREALKLSEEFGRKELVAEDCRRLAFASIRQNKTKEAVFHARRSVEIYTELGSKDLDQATATLEECELAAEADLKTDLNGI